MRWKQNSDFDTDYTNTVRDRILSAFRSSETNDPASTDQALESYTNQHSPQLSARAVTGNAAPFPSIGQELIELRSLLEVRHAAVDDLLSDEELVEELFRASVLQ